MTYFEAVREKLDKLPARSAWERGVREYSHELLDNVEEASIPQDAVIPRLEHDLAILRLWALNGAANWKEYSYGGSSLIYDHDIALRLCNPTELKRTGYGERRPNARETWLDVQARALHQAFIRLQYAVETAASEGVADCQEGVGE